MNQSTCAKLFNAVNIISYVKNLSVYAILSFMKELGINVFKIYIT